MKPILWTAVVTAFFASAAHASEPITDKNWMKHPRIMEIRELVKGIDDAIAASRYAHQEKTTCEPPSLDMQRAVWRDQRGRVRKYVIEGGSDDSAYHLETWYDEAGRLRFAFGRSGAVTDSTVEHRLYFDTGGKLIWKDRRSTGQGYTWIPKWPEEFLPRDPAKAFDAPPDCGD